MDAWSWQDGSEDRFYEVENSGLYNVMVTKDGCINFDSIYISKGSVKIAIPNAFSPNGDGQNDEFGAISNEPLVEYQLLIFDRWGKLIFESHQIEQGWNGRYNGEECPLGTYAWKISYSYYNTSEIESKTQQGTATLVR